MREITIIIEIIITIKYCRICIDNINIYIYKIIYFFFKYYNLLRNKITYIIIKTLSHILMSMTFFRRLNVGTMKYVFLRKLFALKLHAIQNPYVNVCIQYRHIYLYSNYLLYYKY